MKKKKNRFFILSIILIIYSLIFIATSKDVICEGDCEKINNFNSAIRNGRESYVEWAFRCGPNQLHDEICILVKDTSGINWNLLADTACNLATQKGLLQQKIFIIKNFSSPPDTLARKVCP